MFRSLFLAGILLISCITADGVTAEEHLRAQELYSSRNFRAAAAELMRIKEADGPGFDQNNYDYLLARSLHRSGNIAAALPHYASVSKRGSVLKPYALLRLATIAGDLGNPMLERMYLEELRSFAPKSLLSSVAANLLARSYSGTRNFDLAANAFERTLRGTGTRADGSVDVLERENLVLLGESLMYGGDRDRARAVFQRVIDSAPEPTAPDDAALHAARGLDLLDGIGQSDERPAMSAREHMQRASAYQFNRDFDRARAHYQAIVNFHDSREMVPEAIYQIGRGYALSNAFADAVTWFERLQEQFPESDAARSAILQAAAAYARLGKYKESAFRYRIFIDRFPDDERIDRAYLNLIDIARDHGEEVTALRHAATAREVFKGKPAEAQALFAEARIYIAREDWRAAGDALEQLRGLPDLGGTRVPGGTVRDEVDHLRAMVAERSLEPARAAEIYLSITDGPNRFYGGLATERLRALAIQDLNGQTIGPLLKAAQAKARSANTDESRGGLQELIRLEPDPPARLLYLDELREVYAKLPEYTLPKQLVEQPRIGRQEIVTLADQSGTAKRTIAGELAFLGLWDEAATEIEAGSEKHDPARIADLYLRGDNAGPAIGLAESRIRLPADFQIELLPRHVVEMLYPTPYADDLIASAGMRNVDPRMLLAIMRQESRFRPAAKSNAAARGLMQFIPSTANRIAGELGLRSFDPNDLYDPKISILMGSKYVEALFALFPDQPSAVAASYNAGEDNMKRWKARSRSDDPAFYVPEIMYAQTKDYVFKVMCAYRVYSTMYDEQLRQR